MYPRTRSGFGRMLAEDCTPADGPLLVSDETSYVQDVCAPSRAILERSSTIPSPEPSARRWLKGTANVTDWRVASQVCDKIDTGADAYKTVARAVAKARYRGMRDALEALGLDTGHLYDSAEDSDEA